VRFLYLDYSDCDLRGRTIRTTLLSLQVEKKEAREKERNNGDYLGMFGGGGLFGGNMASARRMPSQDEKERGCSQGDVVHWGLPNYWGGGGSKCGGKSKVGTST